MGNASLEVNIIQQMTDIREEVLYEVFLDLWKAYGALYTDRYFEVLVGYGIRPRSEISLLLYWENLLMVDWAGRYYLTQFKGS